MCLYIEIQTPDITNLTVISSDEIQLTWTYPDVQCAPIDGFNISWTFGSSRNTIQTNGSMRAYIINIQEMVMVTYTVSISAFYSGSNSRVASRNITIQGTFSWYNNI